MVASPVPQDVISRIDRLERALANSTNKTLYSANIAQGGLTVNGTGGITVNNAGGTFPQFSVGPTGDANAHVDGTPQVATIISDETGQKRITVWDPNSPSNPAHQQTYIWDSGGRFVFTTDVNGGQAWPWVNVPMYPRFTPPQAATDTNGTVYGYATIGTSATSATGSAITQGQVLWEGRIQSVSHPWISPDGIWGQASGTVMPTYSLLLNGTTVGTWSEPALIAAPEGPWNISSYLGQTAVQVQIKVTWTGTGMIAADMLGCYLRQT